MNIRTRVRKRWRAWIRAAHRDIGYLAVGFTFIYAISGIAINHIDDWNPNFISETRQHELGPLPETQQEATALIRKKLSIPSRPSRADLYAGQLELEWQDRRILAEISTGSVTEDLQRPRFFLRIANWLHYNRGKKAWTRMADLYALGLLYLAISGLFMLKGKGKIRIRRWLLVGLGIAIPASYVWLSGGPTNQKEDPPAEVTSPR